MAGPRTRYVAVAEEATYGTEITDTNKLHYTDAESTGLDEPTGRNLIYETITSRANKEYASGPHVVSGDLVMPLDAVIGGWFVKWALGSYYSVTALDPGKDLYNHVFRGANILDSFTALVGKDHFEHAFSGCKLNGLTIELPKSGYGKLTADVVGAKGEKNTIKSEAICSVENVSYFTFANASMTFGGSSANVESLSLKIDNGISGDDGVRLGSIHPVFMEPGYRNIELTADITFDDTTYLEAFWGAASAASDASTYPVVITLTGGAIGSTGDYYDMVITLPAVLVQDAPSPISKRDRVVQSVKMVAMYDCTSGYDVQIAVTNAQETYSIEEQLHAVDLYDASNMMVGGTFGTFQTTINGGTAFLDKTLSGSTTERINAVAFTSATAGFAVGDAGVIYVTADGGATWTAKTSGVTTNLYGIYNVDGSVVYVCGAGGVILKTTDGDSFAAATTGVTKDLYAIDGYDSTHVIAVGEDGTVIESSDGTNWGALNSGVVKNLLGVVYVDNTTTQDVLACGEDGTIIKSTDAGSNFSTISVSGLTADLHGIACDSANLEGYVVGVGGVVYYTANTGTTWTASTIGTTPSFLYGVACLSSNADTAIIVGSDETIYTTTNAGSTWTLRTLA